MEITITEPITTESKGHFRTVSGFDPDAVGGFALVGDIIDKIQGKAGVSYYVPDLYHGKAVVFGLKVGVETLTILLRQVVGLTDKIYAVLDGRQRCINTKDCQVVRFSTPTHSPDQRYMGATQALGMVGIIKPVQMSSSNMYNPYYLIGIAAVSIMGVPLAPGKGKKKEDVYKNEPPVVSPDSNPFQAAAVATPKQRLRMQEYRLPDLLDKPTPQGFMAGEIILVAQEDGQLNTLAYMTNHIGALTGQGWSSTLLDQAQKLEALAAVLRMLATSATMQRAVNTPGAKLKNKKGA